MAEMARGTRHISTGLSDDDDDDDDTDDNDGDDLSGADIASLGLRHRVPTHQSHERETASQALRRLRAFQAGTNGSPSSSSSIDPVDYSSLPDLHPSTRQHMSTLSSVHARVNSLQRQIDSELHEIERTRNIRHERERQNDELQQRYPQLDSHTGEDEQQHSSDDEDDSYTSPTIALTQSRPTRRDQPSQQQSSPPRQPSRLTANFTPYVSAADRARREMDSNGSSSSASVDVGDGAADGIRIGSLNVRLDRAAALRSEMVFLSSLFDNVRSYQMSLVQSLHQAGYVDDQSMERLPGLHAGLIHYLIESAWAAAARAQGVDGANLFETMAADGMPKLPEGHAQRVKELPSSCVTASNTTSSSSSSFDDCCICLDTMGIGTHISTLHDCHHSFHTRCIQEWLGKANTCPLCKRVAIPDPKQSSDTHTKPTATTTTLRTPIQVQ